MRALCVPVLAGLAMLAVAGCTSSSAPRPTTSTVTSTVTGTRTPSPASTFTPEPVATVRPLPPGTKPRAGEKERHCPYVRTGLNQDAGGGVNMADLEGDRIYRTTVLTRYHPVGCRFYFYAGPYEAVADIRPFTFPTATAAYNAMVLTARTGRNAIPEPNFTAHLTGVSFQTRYFGPDGRRDWAFAFAKGKLMVVIYTQRKDTSRNAVYIARAVAAEF
ncbi:MAG TPA: hypothetical protein VHC23_01600 [Jatrophihabitans sp.]|nr:hypothetical protein [Jatrophihabitans sp.]